MLPGWGFPVMIPVNLEVDHFGGGPAFFFVKLLELVRHNWIWSNEISLLSLVAPEPLKVRQILRPLRVLEVVFGLRRLGGCPGLLGLKKWQLCLRGL